MRMKEKYPHTFQIEPESVLHLGFSNQATSVHFENTHEPTTSNAPSVNALESSKLTVN